MDREGLLHLFLPTLQDTSLAYPSPSFPRFSCRSAQVSAKGNQITEKMEESDNVDNEVTKVGHTI